MAGEGKSVQRSPSVKALASGSFTNAFSLLDGKEFDHIINTARQSWCV